MRLLEATGQMNVLKRCLTSIAKKLYQDVNKPLLQYISRSLEVLQQHDSIIISHSKDP